MNNIWEIVTVTDLIRIIKENPNKFVILSLVLESTPKDLQGFIKKFIKNKSKKFPNMTFLFFKLNKKDLGKFSLLDNDVTQYPLIYHIYDINNIFIKVSSAIKETITEAFNKGEEYYLQDLEKYNNKSLSTSSKSNIQVNNIIDKQNNSHDLHDLNKENKKIETPKPLSQEEEWEKQQEQMANQQKLIARVINLQQKGKEYNLEILKDIKQRKKEEEQIKKK